MNSYPVLLLLSFILGSIPTGLLIAKLSGVDIRMVGSGNIGATNVARALGKKAGTITLALDMLKGILATILPALIISDANRTGLAAVCGLVAVAGHCFSPLLKFKGGKGVATSLGVFLSIAPLPTLCTILLFVSVVKVSRYVSLGSVLAALALPFLMYCGLGGDYLPFEIQCSAVAALLIVSRHRTNISRILSGTENRWRAAESR